MSLAAANQYKAGWVASGLISADRRAIEKLHQQAGQQRQVLESDARCL